MAGFILCSITFQFWMSSKSRNYKIKTSIIWRARTHTHMYSHNKYSFRLIFVEASWDRERYRSVAGIRERGTPTDRISRINIGTGVTLNIFSHYVAQKLNKINEEIENFTYWKQLGNEKLWHRENQVWRGFGFSVIYSYIWLLNRYKVIENIVMLQKDQ